MSTSRVISRERCLLKRTRNDPSLAVEGVRPAPRKADYWHNVAPQCKLLGAPLRPATEDIGFCTAAIDAWVQSNGSPRVLSLGVTPELYFLPWPKGTDLLAVDRTPSMIDAV